MSDNGHNPVCGYAVQGSPPAMLENALRCLGRTGFAPQILTDGKGSTAGWIRQMAERLRGGICRVAVLFCDDPELACCVANKIPGIRAASVRSIEQGCRALRQLGSNLLIVEMAGRTYFEFKQLLRLASGDAADCPPEVAATLRELDGHAHR